MENASKALIMAGSVLLAMLIIGALVFTISTISSMHQTEDSMEDAEKLAEFNRQIQTFNKQTIYGSELISLSNLIDDYNFRQADLKGYEPIKFEVITTTSRDIITPATYTNYKSGTKKISTVFNTLEEKVNKAKTEYITIEYRGNKISETSQRLSGMRDAELEELVKRLTKGFSVSEDDIQNLKNDLREKGNTYTIFNSELVNFKSSKFERISFEYDQGIGRVISVKFEE